MRSVSEKDFAVNTMQPGQRFQDFNMTAVRSACQSHDPFVTRWLKEYGLFLVLIHNTTKKKNAPSSPQPKGFVFAAISLGFANGSADASDDGRFCSDHLQMAVFIKFEIDVDTIFTTRLKTSTCKGKKNMQKP